VSGIEVFVELNKDAKREGAQMRIKVIKADGSVEEYLYTKVVGTINNALSAVDQADVDVAEQLAEVVTYFLYHEKKSRSVNSSEIFSVVKTALAATEFEDAAAALVERHFQRRLKRSRIEVVSVDIHELTDAQQIAGAGGLVQKTRWDKSIIVNDLVAKYGLCQQTARTIASMVEEKVFGMEISLVPSSLIKQLVLSDAAAVLRAQHQLQTV
jgi:transcriptional regulator NrdR family protein